VCEYIFGFCKIITRLCIFNLAFFIGLYVGIIQVYNENEARNIKFSTPSAII